MMDLIQEVSSLFIHVHVLLMQSFSSFLLTIEYPVSRGPICFDCEDVTDPADCHTITPCERNQVGFGVACTFKIPTTT
jgi:hypothetical protein